MLHPFAFNHTDLAPSARDAEALLIFRPCRELEEQFAEQLGIHSHVLADIGVCAWLWSAVFNKLPGTLPQWDLSGSTGD